MNELALFAGGGGGILGGLLLGWRTVCAVELDPYARSVLLARQRDGMLPPFPLWDNVSTFDGKPWRGHVDVISGGFPCQDISCAGKGAGIDGERSGLWSEFARIIREVRPRYAFIENSPMLIVRGLDRVLCDLAAMGFDAEWGIVGAHHVGAFHRRDRIWIVAHTRCALLEKRPEREWNGRRGNVEQHDGDTLADTQGERRGEARKLRHAEPAKWAAGSGEAIHDANSIDRHEMRWAAQWQGRHIGEPGGGTRRSVCFLNWPTEPRVGRVATGVAHRVDRLRALGNGQVPRVAATTWRILSERAAEAHDSRTA